MLKVLLQLQVKVSNSVNLISADQIIGAVSTGSITLGQLAESAVTIAGQSVQLGQSISADQIIGAVSTGSITLGQLAEKRIIIDNNIWNLGDIIKSDKIISGVSSGSII